MYTWYDTLCRYYECLVSLVTSGSPVDWADTEGVTPLMLAAVGDTEGRAVEYLLGHRARPGVADRQGHNCLHYAAAAGNSGAVQQLLEWAGDELGREAGGSTALHLAATNGHKDSLVILLSRQEGADTQDSRGRSPLYLARSVMEVDRMLPCLTISSPCPPLPPQLPRPLGLCRDPAGQGGSRGQVDVQFSPFQEKPLFTNFIVSTLIIVN